MWLSCHIHFTIKDCRTSNLSIVPQLQNRHTWKCIFHCHVTSTYHNLASKLLSYCGYPSLMIKNVTHYEHANKTWIMELKPYIYHIKHKYCYMDTFRYLNSGREEMEEKKWWGTWQHEICYTLLELLLHTCYFSFTKRRR